MRELLEGLKDFWDGQPELSRFFTGGVHLLDAPGTIHEPYVVVGLAENPFYMSWSGSNTRQGCNLRNRKTFIVMFWIYSEGTSDPTTSVDGAQLVYNTFPQDGFSVDGFHMVHFKWQNTNRPETVDNKWVVTLEYECILEEV